MVLERARDIELMSAKDVLGGLNFPKGLEHTALTPNKRTRLVRNEDKYVLQFRNGPEFSLDNPEAINSLYDLTGLPKVLSKSPDHLVAPLLQHHIQGLEKVIAITDGDGLMRLERADRIGPALPVEQVMTELAEKFPEVAYHQANVADDGLTLDLLAITHNDTRKLEELIKPGLHEFLPDGGEPFRAGVHLKFSPMGIVQPLIEPYLVRVICANGAIHAEYLNAFDGTGYGEGDEMWQWFRQGLDHVGGAIDDVMEKYAGLIGEPIPDGEERMLAVNGMIRAAKLPNHMGEAIRDMAIANPPHNAFDMFNLLTYTATHQAKGFEQQLKAQTKAGANAEPGVHAQWCPTCHRN
ncbi:MAG: hypothetical protein V3R38_00655 [bacterium]